MYLDGKCYIELAGYSNTESCADAGPLGVGDENEHDHEHHKHEDDNDGETVCMHSSSIISSTNQIRRPQQNLSTAQSGILTL